MLRIRLMRMGRRNRPQYRVVVTDARRPRESKYEEVIGFYDPVPHPKVCNIRLDRYEYWVKRGAQPSGAVRQIIKIARERAKQTASSTETDVNNA